MAQPQAPARPGPYNMAALGNALPHGNYRQGHYHPSQLRYNPSGSTPGMVGQAQAMPQYSGQSAMGQVPNPAYYMQQQAQMPPYYGTPLSPSQPQSNMSPRANMPYYGNQLMANPQSHPTMAYYYGQMPQFPPHGQSPHVQGIPPSYMPVPGSQPDSRVGATQGGDNGNTATFVSTQEPTQTSSDSRSNVVRGPPRKPLQSGHAIWIGNLPSQADLMSLVHHVCKEAEGLESLFLIAKSNCAFANYRDEASCLAAQQKLHESKFLSVRLVSRLRKNTVEGAAGVTAPTGPSATTPQAGPPEPKESVTTNTTEVEPTRSEAGTPSVTSVPDSRIPSGGDLSAQKDKFFILKSLTVEDLELSVRTGIWATQAHNEETLNHAFQTAENVYLVFSANKSGEYFGYARMVSTINEDPAAAIEFAPKVQSVSDVDLPKEIPTEATESTPKGRIIDDSARGTIFWEVVRDDLTDGAEPEEITPAAGDQDNESSVGGDGGPESRTWGKPFKLEWLCTTRLPFYRCRGLRNPWNSNREVKIARDGTELEPSVGRRLIGLFNKNHSNPAPRGPMGGAMGHFPMQQPMMMGYPPPYP
ncbi:Zinc finger CCCH domain-containing protein 45 [Cytospora mali]|uniref:Zinc finger CCCH domain-containing protein 45 n=1 Tax=Cytospora mali TaxID=578113 RepID=A0A194UQT0_CYTMA|nr:Zinc finger CCCH domain-containing protein 45 [Valsa mali var. pyri (nom. inval.)]